MFDVRVRTQTRHARVAVTALNCGRRDAMFAMCIAAACTSTVWAEDAAATREQGTLTKTLDGVQINIGLTSELVVLSSGERALHLVADLTDLQAKANLIVAKGLPARQCETYGLNHLYKVSEAKLTAADGTAQLAYAGSVQAWDCQPNPVLNSRVVFDGLAARVETWDAAPIVTLVGNKSVKASYSLDPGGEPRMTDRIDLKNSMVQSLEPGESSKYLDSAKRLNEAISPNFIFGGAVSGELATKGDDFKEFRVEQNGEHLIARSTLKISPDIKSSSHFLSTDVK